MTTKAIVIGASVAGLMAARALSDRADEVVIFERDDIPDGPDPRGGVPQGRHAHALLGAGDKVMKAWFPGLRAQLVEKGAVELQGENVWWYEGGGFKVRSSWGASVLTFSRPLLEHNLRQRVRQLPNVTLVSPATIDDFIVVGDRVVGVVVDGKVHNADLIVDCSGRYTRSVELLQAKGFAPPTIEQVEVGLVYRSVLLRRGENDFDGQSAQISPDFPDQSRRAVLLPIEGDRWLLTLIGMHGDVPPADEQGFSDYARSLPTPFIADVFDGVEKISQPVAHRLPSSQWRRFDKLERHPRGFLVLGDAVTSFNPIYGQGMTSASLQAQSLHELLATEPLSSPHLARKHYKRVTKIIMGPWSSTVGVDFAHPKTTGKKAWGTGLMNRYLRLAHEASHTSPKVSLKLMQVQNLVAPKSALFNPIMVARVFFASLRSPARTGRGQPRPKVFVGKQAPSIAFPGRPAERLAL
ncbi:hypothetical protein LP421_33805 (plasmid) [Rhizobium sp. RCAM05350]|uniref:FAD-dependent oxidoreductase n=1 Tax=Rhizobium sp. RCAM05350 TaxID=2895568 RepID=UPI002076B5A1|nr:hypothetical protein [Rhizobium sp. RCAM05350]URK89395.1 hypothetical protein LP421_33805 [Rhizobium sp. RCAM05350]